MQNSVLVSGAGVVVVLDSSDDEADAKDDGFSVENQRQCSDRRSATRGRRRNNCSELSELSSRTRVLPSIVAPLPLFRDTDVPLIDLTEEFEIGPKRRKIQPDPVVRKPDSAMAENLDGLSNEEVIKRLTLALKCPICQHSISNISSTKCGHLFCKTCIESAARIDKKCPNCRMKLSIKDIHRIFF